MKVTCKELGTDCPYIAEGKTESEVTGKMLYHGATDHGMMDSGESAFVETADAIHGKIAAM